jgi:hypothetical protein
MSAEQQQTNKGSYQVTMAHLSDETVSSSTLNHSRAVALLLRPRLSPVAICVIQTARPPFAPFPCSLGGTLRGPFRGTCQYAR